ncbi:MAG: hypothetical protein KGO49_02965 [Gammaproteobacteria bacterium]|nr:hypothetical protein [Gammaproteobacteria bacterium]
MKRLIFQKLALRAFIIIPVLVSGCDSRAVNWHAILFEKSPPTLFIPFRLDKAGFVLNKEFETKARSQVYFFDLAFKPKVIDGNKEQLHRVIRLLERNNHYNDQYIDANGVVIYPRHGIKIPLRLTIIRIDSSQEIQIYDQIFDRLYSSGGGTEGFLPSEIDGVRISPGKYRIRLEALETVPELADIDVELYVRATG